MRSDMAKILVERPRIGHSKRYARRGRSCVIVDDDGAPLRARAEGRLQKTKTLNENLAPLKRYLAAQVGRPWDKVYSEIARRLKPTSTVQQHVRDHIEDFVAVRTRMVDGVVHHQGKFGGLAPVANPWGHPAFFVHPKTGLLKRAPRAKR
jgi:hypothetical protein